MPLSQEFLDDRSRHLVAKLEHTKKAAQYAGILPAAKKYKEAEHIPQIIAAMERLKNGSYGFCFDCQDEIPRERLLLHPHVERCISCQEDIERRKKNQKKP